MGEYRSISNNMIKHDLNKSPPFFFDATGPALIVSLYDIFYFTTFCLPFPSLLPACSLGWPPFIYFLSQLSCISTFLRLFLSSFHCLPFLCIEIGFEICTL